MLYNIASPNYINLNVYVLLVELIKDRCTVWKKKLNGLYLERKPDLKTQIILSTSKVVVKTELN